MKEHHSCSNDLEPRGLGPRSAVGGSVPGGVAILLAGATLAGIVLAFAAGAVFLRRGESPSLPIYWNVPEFALVDQHGDTLRSDDLQGKAWVGSFVFTHCQDVCPLVSAQMARLRDRLADGALLGSQVRLVSFSVDPARDTPEVLREYAGNFGGSPSQEWAFLTGASVTETERLVQDGFRLTMLHPGRDHQDHAAAQGGYQVAHSPRIILVDRSGQVRGSYDATDSEAMGRLDSDLRLLLEQM